MFSGIVDHLGEIIATISSAKGIQLQIRTRFENISLGESIAVEGICLTVTKTERHQFFCDVSPETLAVTTAQYFHSGQRVNLERALAVGDRLGGHFVTGHVDGVVCVAAVQPQGEFTVMKFTGLQAEHFKLILPKGCVAINGVSLTINEVSSDSFSVMLIPHTLSHTTLHTLNAHDRVNIEYDYLARVIARQLDCEQRRG